MDRAEFEALVRRAAQAPSVHNTQPARWALREARVLVGGDLSVRLPAGDPSGPRCRAVGRRGGRGDGAGLRRDYAGGPGRTTTARPCRAAGWRP